MDVRNLTRERFDITGFQKTAEAVLVREKKGKSDLSLLFVGEAQMRELNKRWRDKDYAANVLAFPGGELSLGEVVLCPPVIRKDAKEYGITYQETTRLMFVHGLLHLLGYDHKTPTQEKRMKSKEQQYLSL